jgi:hypothetical protein
MRYTPHEMHDGGAECAADRASGEGEAGRGGERRVGGRELGEGDEEGKGPGLAHEVHAHEVHAREVHAREMHAHGMHVCEMHVYEIHAYEMQMMPIRYTPMRHMPVRCFSILISLSTLLSSLNAEFSIYPHSPPCRSLLFMLYLTLGARGHVRRPALVRCRSKFHYLKGRGGIRSR